MTREENNNNNFNSMAQGFQQMNFGGVSNANSQNQSHEESGFGSPMGGGNVSSSATTTNDPFSSLGGMNAFRQVRLNLTPNLIKKSLIKKSKDQSLLKI